VVTLLLALLLNPAHAIKVMLIDTGVDNHYLFKGRVITSNVGINDHGTHVAGIILHGGLNLDGTPVSTTCPEVVIANCNYQPSVVECLDLADRGGFDYVNISLTGKLRDTDEYLMLKKLTSRGVKITVAAGNESADLRKNPVYPAYYMYDGLTTNFFVVGSTVPSSNRGEGVIIRPGTVLSTLMNGRMGYLTGTSMSAPYYLHELLLEECKQIENRTVDPPSSSKLIRFPAIPK